MSKEEIKLENMASPERHGNREFTLFLLSLYREAPELWKVKSKLYFDKNKKAAATTRITNALKALDRNFTEKELKKKINKLRTSFNRELKKIKESMKFDEVYVPKLWYFNEMSFLLGSGEGGDPRGSVDLPGPSQDNRHTIKMNKRKRKKLEVQKEVLNLSTSTYISNKEEDEYDVMGKAWAIQVRQLRPDQKIFARKIINDVLFEGAMGTLTRHGVSFLPNVSVEYPVNTPNITYSSDSS